MKKALIILGIILGIPTMLVIFGLSYYRTTYNGLVTQQQGITSQRANLDSCYEQRAELYGNMVGAAREAAGSEKDITIGYAQGRSGLPKLSANPTDEERSAYAAALKASQEAISKFQATVEAVPHIKSNRNYLEAQRKFSDMSQKCEIARRRIIQAIYAFNSHVVTFPANLVAGAHNIKEQKQLEIENAENNRRTPNLFEKK